MPPKSSTAKPVKRTTAAPEGQGEGSAADKSKKPVKPKTTSLIDAEPKPKRSGPLKTGSAFTSFGSKPAAKTAAKAAAPAKPAEPPKKSLDQEKAEALNLFDEQEKKEQAKRDRRAEPSAPPAPMTQSSSLPPISLLREPDPVVSLPPKEEPKPAPVLEEGIDPKVIHIKPPILVKDLSDRMGLKLFQVIKDLIEFKVFAKNGETTVDTEVAAKICEKHGFIFEKEKREKGAGVHKIEEKI
jgi:translation initiation factor IF-2